MLVSPCVEWTNCMSFYQLTRVILACVRLSVFVIVFTVHTPDELWSLTGIMSNVARDLANTNTFLVCIAICICAHAWCKVNIADINWLTNTDKHAYIHTYIHVPILWYIHAYIHTYMYVYYDTYVRALHQVERHERYRRQNGGGRILHILYYNFWEDFQIKVC